MKTHKQRNIDLNWKVAELLGWSNLFQIVGSIVGRPPGGSPHSRDQGMVPDWAGDFTECCKLGLNYDIYPRRGEVELMMRNNEMDRELAYRHVMLDHLCTLLTLNQNRCITNA